MSACAVVNDFGEVLMSETKNPPVIALLTDFGYKDIYAGVLKGVIMSIAPQTNIVDVTHGVHPGEIEEGAFALLNAFSYFPTGTIFVCVVDPGVGSARKAIAVQAGGYTFVAPDNGLLSYVVQALKGDYQAVTLTNADYQRADVSATFHGRDIFAPVAAHLSSGVPFAVLGDPLPAITLLSEPECKVGRKFITGEILYTDQYGNATTSIGRITRAADGTLTLTPAFGKKRGEVITLPSDVIVRFRHFDLAGISRTYADAEPDELIALIGSGGFLELALNSDNFAYWIGAQPGDQVRIVIG